MSLLASGIDIGHNAEIVVRSFSGPEASGDLQFCFCHAKIPLGLVIVKIYGKVPNEQAD